MILINGLFEIAAISWKYTFKVTKFWVLRVENFKHIWLVNALVRVSWYVVYVVWIQYNSTGSLANQSPALWWLWNRIVEAGDPLEPVLHQGGEHTCLSLRSEGPMPPAIQKRQSTGGWLDRVADVPCCWVVAGRSRQTTERMMKAQLCGWESPTYAKTVSLSLVHQLLQ